MHRTRSHCSSPANVLAYLAASTLFVSRGESERISGHSVLRNDAETEAQLYQYSTLTFESPVTEHMCLMHDMTHMVEMRPHTTLATHWNHSVSYIGITSYHIHASKVFPPHIRSTSSCSRLSPPLNLTTLDMKITRLCLPIHFISTHMPTVGTRFFFCYNFEDCVPNTLEVPRTGLPSLFSCTKVQRTNCMSKMPSVCLQST